MTKFTARVLMITVISLMLASHSTAGSSLLEVSATSLEKLADYRISAQAQQRIKQTLKKRRSASKWGLTTHSSKVDEQMLKMEGIPSNRQNNKRMPIFIDNQGYARIELKVSKNNASLFKDLDRQGVEVTLNRIDDGNVVVAVPSDRLFPLMQELKTWPSIKNVRPVLRPLLRSGAVQSEGDIAQGSFDARQLFEVDGSDVSVCVISDGMKGVNEAIASKDLPSNSDGTPEIEMCSINENSGSEGIALLEIIHDVAPGAKLGFCSGSGNGQTGFVAAIEWLAFEAFEGEGCDIIVDDISFLDEPYFQDGPVAQAVNRVSEAGVTYFTSAGNGAMRHYEHEYFDTDPSSQTNVHDFGIAAGKESDIAWSGVVGPEAFLAVILQWNEAFGKAKSNYNLLLFDGEGVLAGTSKSVFQPGNALQGTQVQNGDDDPSEFAAVINKTKEEQIFLLVVDRMSGKDHTLELNFNSPNFKVDSKYNIPDGSIFGHSAACLGISVGATGAKTNVGDIPNNNLDIIEPFSSRGPSRIFFTETGSPIDEKRKKPDIIAPDGISVSGAGGFSTSFYGTSAAAPHAAAVAALLIDAAGEKLHPSEIKSLLKDTAFDRGAQGYDFVWGCGLIDAYSAVGHQWLYNDWW